MKQTVRVTKVFSDGTAEVFLERQSACSGDCHQCSGCGAVREKLFVTADNLIGASVGDAVVVETSTASVMKAALLVYIVPVVLFFAAYFAGAAIPFYPGLSGLAGFLLGLIPAVCLNRRMMRSNRQSFQITAFVQEN